MRPDSFVEIHFSDAERAEVGNGIVVHRLYRSGPERTARRALLVRFPAGSRWPGVDKGARWEPEELSEIVPALVAEAQRT